MTDHSGRVHQQRLLDVYGAVLTERQLEACRLHLDEDWSFAELAEHFGVSRAAAHDLVKRGLAQVEELERKLGHSELLLQAEANGNV